MSFIVEQKTESTFKPVPAGLHLGRCWRIIDLGSQKVEYMGETKVQRKIMIGWELFGEDTDGAPLKTDDGKPMSIFKQYTLSWSENANLRKDLQAWRGKAWTDAEASRFDLKAVLGAYCMLNVIVTSKNGKTYSNVDGIAPVPAMIKSSGLPDGVNKAQLFTIADPDMQVFDSLSNHLKQKIENSPEWQSKGQPKTSAQSWFDDMEDEIPF